MSFYLDKEIKIAKALIYRLKNQHKSTLMYKRLKFLVRMVKKNDKRVPICCENLYLASTANLALGHFVSLSVVILGVSSRIWYLFHEKNDISEEEDEIDDIFNKKL